MGCWNATCGLSRLPIFAGESVIGLLIAGVGYTGRGGSAGAFCYPTDKYASVSLPLFGSYNDYGSIEDIKETDSSKILAKQFNAKELEDFIYNHVEEGSVVIDDENGRGKKIKQPVGLWMCRKDIIDEYFADGGIFETYDRKTYKTIKHNLHERLESDFVKYWKYIENMKESLAVYFGDVVLTKDDLRGIRFYRLEMDSMPREDGEDNLIDYTLGKIGYSGSPLLTYESFKVYREYIKWLIYKGYEVNSPEALQIRDDIIYMYKINEILRDTRNALVPQCGAGSQQDDLDPYKRLYKAGRKAMTTIRHRHD